MFENYNISNPESDLDNKTEAELRKELSDLQRDLEVLLTEPDKIPADIDRIDYLKARIAGIERRLETQ